jgi:REP element-mobilizing transposase RayT
VARPLRIEVSGGLYHVIARGNERKAVFRDDGDRTKYLDRIAIYRERFRFRLLAFCLMDKHVHLAIETGKTPLSKIMAGLQSSYTQYFNWKHDRVGHLFRGRYKALLVGKNAYALALVRYIHENPVKAHVVEKPEQYVWSSDRFYRRGRGPGWLDCDRVLGMLGNRRSAAVREYRRLMREEVEEPYEDVPSWGGAVKGDEAFADRILQTVGEPSVVPRGMTIEHIAAEVARTEGLDLSRMRSPVRDRESSRARLMVAWLAREVGRIPVAQSAEFFRRSGGTMIIGLERLDEAMRTDGSLRRKLSRLSAGLLRTGPNNSIIDD